MKSMKKRNIVYYLLLILIMAVLTGCGYTQEEKAENYIKAKYGIDAKVRELNCEKYNSGPVPDFFPSPTGNVFIRMNYQGKDFSVFISGERENTEGIDNYQFQEIVTAFSQELDEITGFHAESVFVSYGEYETVNDEKN